jgi:hypothetical protein
VFGSLASVDWSEWIFHYCSVDGCGELWVAAESEYDAWVVVQVLLGVRVDSTGLDRWR